ncbi:MAG: acyl-CoA dehydratase activase-related protein [Desulfitobacterium sp.]
MKGEITIGIPRAFLYFKYQYLWKTFFAELNCQVILSPETNKKILKDGIDHSIDESCLSAKIYMGHLAYLRGKADYILVPRIVGFGENEEVCTKFNALYDIVKNTFKEVNLLSYNVDVANQESEFKGFMRMGRELGKNPVQVLKAYLKAKAIQTKKEHQLATEQESLIRTGDQLKILIVSHDYNTYDRVVGYPIINYLESLDIVPIYANIADKKKTSEKSKLISENLYWTYNKELIGAIDHYQGEIDGIIFISTFPCGPDSLVNELCLRKIKGVPMANLIVDELQGEAGLQTRIESFVDIIMERKKAGRIAQIG